MRSVMVRILSTCALLLAVALAGCQSVGDDLNPSGADKRPSVSTGTTGNQPGQIAADFSVVDSLGNTVRLSDQLSGGATPSNAVVLYFTMWCPICLAHSDHMVNTVVPQFASRGTVRYYVVDYVSGSVSATRSNELANGYAGSALTTLADVNQLLYNQFNAAMGTVVVIDSRGTIVINEDYRDGTPVVNALNSILP